MREAFIRGGRLPPQHETGDDHAEESAIAVHRRGAHRIVDLEPAFDPVVQLVDNDRNSGTDQQGLDRMVEIVAGRGGNDAAQSA